MNYPPRCTTLILDKNNASATPFTYKTSSLFSPRRLTRRSYGFGIGNCLRRLTMTKSSLTVICRMDVTYHSHTSFFRKQGLQGLKSTNLVRFSRVPSNFSIVSFLTFPHRPTSLSFRPLRESSLEAAVALLDLEKQALTHHSPRVQNPPLTSNLQPLSVLRTLL